MIIKIMGGLGNQMFQYAFGLAMSERYHKKLCLDVSFFENHQERSFELDFYNVPYKAKNVYRLYNYLGKCLRKMPQIRGMLGEITEKKDFIFEDRVLKKSYRYYVGYWQNLEYIKSLRSRLKEYFEYKGELPKVQQQLIEEIHGIESVAVHIRHGDYQEPYYQGIYCIPSEEYYRKAMEYIEKQCKTTMVKYYFFSDDIKWCKETFADIEKCFFVDEEVSDNAHIDFMLMRNCKHIITANSTFSWWAAWLKEQEGLVVVPSRWYRDEKRNSEAIRALLEPEWVRIDDD